MFDFDLFHTESPDDIIANEDDVEEVATGIYAHVVSRLLFAGEFKLMIVGPGGGGGSGCLYAGA